MKYMGSKSRLVKHIVPILNEYLIGKDYYIEPFVGGANVIQHIKGVKRIGFDKNKYLIALLDYVTKNELNITSITEEEYYEVRDNKEKHPDWYVGLVGFCASYGGRFFEGYPRGLDDKGNPRDYTNEAIRNLKKQIEEIKDVVFFESDYINLDFCDKNCLIYCDPPYKGAKPYKTSLLGKFSHDIFWEWVRIQSKCNPVIVSEYDAPDDFVKIWSIYGVKSNLKISGTKISEESLFIHNTFIK